MIIEFKLIQKAKAFSLIDNTLLGIFIEVNPLQFQKA